jgi:plastocyanin
MKPLRPLALLLLTSAASTVALAQPNTAAVHIANFAFSPVTVTVAPGGTVTWVNDDDDAHSVVADAGSFHSSALDTKDSFSFTFRSAGEFVYHCGLHPHMVARVVVRP